MINRKQKKSESLFNELKSSLESAINLEQGRALPGVRVTTVSIAPVRKRSPNQIKSLRTSLAMTQSLFADILGVTKKAVEAWEAGTKNPSGPALRMFEILEKESLVLERVGIFSRKESA